MTSRGPGERGAGFKIGALLIVLSCVLWLSLLVIPFLPLSIGQKAALAGGVFVAVQIAWWSGAALVGPETVKRLRSWWGRKKQ